MGKIDVRRELDPVAHLHHYVLLGLDVLDRRIVSY